MLVIKKKGTKTEPKPCELVDDQAGCRGIVPLITAAFLFCFSVTFLFHEALKLCPWG